MDKFLKNNQNLWNNWAKLHASADSEVYPINAFKAGITSLHDIELNELGNVTGKSLLHLQCHFGLDSLSWARQGAIVTGVDFAEEAIKAAKELSLECQIPAEFICSNLYTLPDTLNKKFDIVYVSYGALQWLPDLNKWAEVVAHFVKPGGICYIVEFHPFIYMLDENWTNVNQAYFANNKPVMTHEQGSYVNKNADIKAISYAWSYALSEVISALIKSGFMIELFHEFPYTPYNTFPGLVSIGNGQYVRSSNPGMPLTYSIRAKMKA